MRKKPIFTPIKKAALQTLPQYENFFLPHGRLTPAILRKFKQQLAARSNERSIDALISGSPSLMLALSRLLKSGNHGTWVIPQKQVRPPCEVTGAGMIPDYFIATKSSEGVLWFVAEMKSPSATLFRSRNPLRLSDAANAGLLQLLRYLDYCAKNQAYLRDELKLAGMREPRGLLIIGREAETADDPVKGSMKAALNAALGGRVEVRSYDAMLVEAEHLAAKKPKRHRSSRV